MEIPVETHHPRDPGGPQEHQKRQHLQLANEQKVRGASSRRSALRFLAFLRFLGFRAWETPKKGTDLHGFSEILLF